MDEPAKDDGYRILVDRLWPRGVTKAKAAIKEWAKDLAPTTELREWFAHDPERWAEFQQRYKAELKKNEAVECPFGRNIVEAKDASTLIYACQGTNSTLPRYLSCEHYLEHLFGE